MIKIPRYIIIFLLGLMAYSYSLNSNAAEEVGRVIVSSGNFYVVGPDKKQRPLTSQSPLYKGDTMVAPSGTQAQIRFKSGNLVSCAPDSSCHVNADNEKSTNPSNAVVSLVKGGIQTIVAAVSNINASESKISSPIATIGVRGTFITTALTNNGQEIAVWKGKAEFSNPAGSIVLGPDTEFKFARAASPTSKPIGLATGPISLTAAIDPKATRILSTNQQALSQETSTILKKSSPISDNTHFDSKPVSDIFLPLQKLVNNGKYDAAFTMAKSMQPQQESDPTFNFLYGQAALQTNHLGEAIFAFERILIKEPTNAKAFFELAKSYYQIGDTNMAKVKFHELLEMHVNQNIRAAAQQYLATLENGK